MDKAGVTKVALSAWLSEINNEIEKLQKSTAGQSEALKVLEGLLLFKDGLPNDEKWENKASVVPTFSQFIPMISGGAPNEPNAELYLEYIRSSLPKK